MDGRSFSRLAGSRAAAALVAVGLAAVCGCGGEGAEGSDTGHPGDHARHPPATAGHPLDRVVRIVEEGRSVTVAALHGACGDGVEVSAVGTRGRVVLTATVTGRRNGGDRTERARMRQVAVELMPGAASSPYSQAYSEVR
ncbi:hypothetical protein [Streptomyces alfalfae]